MWQESRLSGAEDSFFSEWRNPVPLGIDIFGAVHPKRFQVLGEEVGIGCTAEWSDQEQGLITGTGKIGFDAREQLAVLSDQPTVFRGQTLDIPAGELEPDLRLTLNRRTLNGSGARLRSISDLHRPRLLPPRLDW